MKNNVLLADLTHTYRGIQALTFPLGTAYVAAYAQYALGEDFEFSLFKFPDQLSRAIEDRSPRVLALSNYSWNLELGHQLASWAKRLHPNLIVVMGGPNFPTLAEEKLQFFARRPAVDAYIENEGELGFAALLEALEKCDFDFAAFKRSEQRIANCSYRNGDRLIEGEIRRIKDVNIIPSPYLTGLLDEFFAWPLAPMLETTRGCPFKCSFCSDGHAIKNQVVAFEPDRVRAELHYMAERVKLSHEINVTDLNFGMYKEDLETARMIAEVQEKYRWPLLIKGSAGKNKPERVLETADVLKGSWIVGSALQSSDPEVLSNIQRSNISGGTFQKFITHAHESNQTASTYCEIILALPGDTKTKHFNSLRYGVDRQVTIIKQYQAMLLEGTEMASREVRSKYGVVSKFRLMDGGLGIYEAGGSKLPIAEIQEIVVGTKDMPFEDYASCRFMSLIIETYYNHGLSGEVFAALRAMGLSVFDFLVFLHEHRELYNPTVNAVVDRFDVATRNNLYDTYEEAEAIARDPDMFARYLSGEIGFNEILDCKARLYYEMEATQSVLSKALPLFLEAQGVLTDAVENYLGQLARFALCRKKQILDPEAVVEQTFEYPFEEIAGRNYAVDPRTVDIGGQTARFKFYHDAEQRSQINKAVKYYENHPGGMSRLLYMQNLKTFYRHFERV